MASGRPTRRQGLAHPGAWRAAIGALGRLDARGAPCLVLEPSTSFEGGRQLELRLAGPELLSRQACAGNAPGDVEVDGRDVRVGTLVVGCLEGEAVEAAEAGLRLVYAGTCRADRAQGAVTGVSHDPPVERVPGISVGAAENDALRCVVADGDRLVGTRRRVVRPNSDPCPGDVRGLTVRVGCLEREGVRAAEAGCGPVGNAPGRAHRSERAVRGRRNDGVGDCTGRRTGEADHDGGVVGARCRAVCAGRSGNLNGEIHPRRARIDAMTVSYLEGEAVRPGVAAERRVADMAA